jgi:hypothetical protein
MKNTITFLLISLLQCFIYGQDKKINLVGTWSTDDGLRTITIDALLNGIYENKSNDRTLKFIANELPTNISTDDQKTTAVSISLMNDKEGYDKVNSTMTGQAYIDTKDQNKTKLQLFHVLKTDNNDLNSGETLFFTKIKNTPPSVNHIVSTSNFSTDDLIGPWIDSNKETGLNIVYIDNNYISATYNYQEPTTKESFLIKLKGYIQQPTANGNYLFSLSGISIPFPYSRVPELTTLKINSFSMSLVGEIIDNGDDTYSMKSSMNLAHAYGGKDTYSAVRSKGAYFTKSKNSNFTYQKIQNSMERLNFTNNGATNWVSDMKIGSTQTFKMALDTGGNYDWVNSKECTADACTKFNHTQFDAIKSTSFKWIDRTITGHDWATWGTSKASLGYDLVEIEPNTVLSREINLIKEFDPPPHGNMKQFDELLWDGALAIPSFSSGGKLDDPNYRISNIMIDLVTSGTIDPKNLTVSFYYDPKNKQGTYAIGSNKIDATKVNIESKITLAQENYVDTVSTDLYAASYLWSTALHSVKVGEVEIKIDPSKTVFAFDTGSSSLKGDSEKMYQVRNILKASRNLSTIEYSMGVNNQGEPGRFVIDRDQYYQSIEEGEHNGKKQVQVQPLKDLPNLWLQGTTLLEDLYSVFTYDISFNKKGELILKANNVALYNKIGGPQIIQSGNTCEEEFTDLGGVSGNYNNLEFEKIVYEPGEKGKKVVLDFEYIDTEENYDFLSIYNGPDIEEANLIKTYSGKYKNQKIPSTHPSGALTVEFTSDYSITKKGWKAKVNKCSTKTQNHCKEEFTDSGGIDENYQDRARDTIVYKPSEKGKKVVLDFEYIDTEKNYDSLWIYDGPTAEWYNFKKLFTGYHENERITSTHPSGALTVIFNSDESITKKGWKAKVNKCKGKTAFKNSNIEKEQKVISENTLIYPNPVASSLHIIIPSSEETLGDSFISITDVLGKVVGNYIYKESNTSLDIDLSNLSAGSYFIKITNKKEVITKKIIKQ